MKCYLTSATTPIPVLHLETDELTTAIHLALNIPEDCGFNLGISTELVDGIWKQLRCARIEKPFVPRPRRVTTTLMGGQIPLGYVNDTTPESLWVLMFDSDEDAVEWRMRWS